MKRTTFLDQLTCAEWYAETLEKGINTQFGGIDGRIVYQDNQGEYSITSCQMLLEIFWDEEHEEHKLRLAPMLWRYIELHIPEWEPQKFPLDVWQRKCCAPLVKSFAYRHDEFVNNDLLANVRQHAELIGPEFKVFEDGGELILANDTACYAIRETAKGGEDDAKITHHYQGLPSWERITTDAETHQRCLKQCYDTSQTLSLVPFIWCNDYGNYTYFIAPSTYYQGNQQGIISAIGPFSFKLSGTQTVTTTFLKSKDKARL